MVRSAARSALVAALLGLPAGCAWVQGGAFDWLPWRSGPAAPVVPPYVWDHRSPPPLDSLAAFFEPDPVPIALPPAANRWHDDIDVLHYDVELVVPFEGDRVSSRTTIRYLRDGVGTHLLLLDLSGLAVEEVTALGEPIQFQVEPGALLMLNPGRPGIYDTLQVEVMARGTPDDGLILGETVHGRPSAFSDNWPNRARFWFPSNDHPSDKATVSYTVHVPPGYRVVANGLPVGEPVPADRFRTGGVEGLVTWRWTTAVPIPTYLMVVGIAEMEVLDLATGGCGVSPASPRADGCLDVTGWAFAPDTAHAREIFRRSGEMVDLFATLFGPYPFEKLANVQASTRFGGMENASAIFYSERAIADRRNIEDTVAHEIVHQWFGDAVTPADWPEVWLSEGFATYFAAVYREDADGTVAFQQRIDAMRAEYLRSPVVGRPVVDTAALNLLDLLNENSYEKGALVLHMLRWVVGDRIFFSELRRYYERHAGGNATTADLQRGFEGGRGESLDWFFRQWLREPGYPRYRVTWSWDAGSGEARVTIQQEQDDSWPTFRMPIEMEFQMEGGVHRVTEWVEGREWTRSFDLPSQPFRLTLDPDRWLLMESVTGPAPLEAAPPL